MGSSKKKGGGSSGSSSSSNNVFHIPSASKKLVQRLKVVLHDKPCSDFEIYSVLKECNMNPDEAIQILLTQDPFQEVKSKREKRKEKKEAEEPKDEEKDSDDCSSVQVGDKHDVVESSLSHTNSNGSDKSIKKMDNIQAASAPLPALMYRINKSKEQPSPYSDSATEKLQKRDRALLFQRAPATVVSWNRDTSNSGYMSMADVVRLSMHSQTAEKTTCARQDSNALASSFHNLDPFHDSSNSQMGMQKYQQGANSATLSKMSHESVMSSNERRFTNDWPGLEQQTSVSGSSVLNNFTNEGPAIEQNSCDAMEFLLSVEDVAAENTTSTCLTSSVASANVSKMNHESAVASGDRNFNNDWPGLEQRTSVSGSSILNNFTNERPGIEQNSWDAMKFPPGVEDVAAENTNSTCLKSALAFDKQEALDGADDSFYVLPRNVDKLSHQQVKENPDLNDKVPSSVFDFQNPNLRKEDPRKPVSEDISALSFPNCLQDVAADLSHLSFGIYNSGESSTVSEPLTSDSSENNLKKEGLSAVPDPFDPRYTWFNDQIRRCSKVGSNTDSGEFSLFPESESRRQSSSVPGSNEFRPSTVQSLRDSDGVYSSLVGLQSASSRYSSVVPSSVDPIVMPEALNSSAFPLPLSYSLPQHGAMGSELPHHLATLPRSALQRPYQRTGVFRYSQAGIECSPPQFRAAAFRSSWPQNDFLGGDLRTPTSLPRRFHHDLVSPSSSAAIDCGGTRSWYNEDTSTMPQPAQNALLSARNYGPTHLRRVPNVVDGRSYRLPPQNQVLSGYPQTQPLLQNHDSLRNSQAGSVQDQQLGPDGFPPTQAHPSSQFWQQ